MENKKKLNTNEMSSLFPLNPTLGTRALGPGEPFMSFRVGVAWLDGYWGGAFFKPEALG